MAKTKIYLDTNIIADAIDPLRKGHKTAIDVLKKCIVNEWDICISEDILTTLYYISKDKVATLQFIQNIILKEWEVLVFGQKVIQNAIGLSLERSLDLEDVLQCLCAKANGCSLLITNDRNFHDCGIDICTAESFLQKHEN